jgi:outer membrane protein OmpA-like peptidoglycan-associated protein
MSNEATLFCERPQPRAARPSLDLRRIVAVALAFAVLGCATTDSAPGRKSVTGGIAGGVAGALAGAGIAAATGKNPLVGALIGAAAGGALGAGIGAYLDRVQNDFATNVPDATVQRHEDHVTVSLPSTLLFDAQSAHLSQRAGPALDQSAAALNRNPGSTVAVKGHADASGSDANNLVLSEARAESVRNALIERGVDASRITAAGYGETMPIASNDTPEGRAENRRVELEIRPQESGRQGA